MSNIVQINQGQIKPLPRASVDSLKRLAQRLDPADYFFDTADPPELQDHLRERVESIAAQAQIALRPCHPNRKVEILHRLELQKPRRHMDENQSLIFWQDLIEDLEDMPEWALETACRLWRQNSAEKFFPNGSQLWAIVRDDVDAWRDAWSYAQNILAYKRPEPIERLTPERIAQIHKEEADADGTA